MRALIVTALIALAASAFGAEDEHFQLRDANDLVRACSPQASDTNATASVAFCHGFLAGAYRYYAATTPAADQFICAPNPRPSRTKVMNDFVVWAKANPAYGAQPAVDTLFRYLSETYPCKK